MLVLKPNRYYKGIFQVVGVHFIPVWEALTKKIPAKNENYGFLNAVNQVKHMTGCVNITGPK